MGDIDEILADLQYVIAVEKSRSQPEAIIYRKITLPDQSVRGIMEKYLEKTGQLSFERVFGQKLGFSLFKQFCISDPQVRENYENVVTFYEAIREYEKLESTEERLRKAGQIYDDLIIAELLDHRYQFSTKALQHVQRLLIKSHVPTDLFKIYINEIHARLSGEVFAKFLTSDKFTRFCQWKNFEMNLNLTKDHFVIHRVLGRGGFGLVYGCVKMDTGKMYAMKCLDKKRIKLRLNSETLALNERIMLSLVSSGEECPFIVCMTYAFQTADQLVFIMNLMNGGDLSYHLKQRKKHFNEVETKFYASEILLGIQHLYNRCVVHRDLKPANVLMDEFGHVRISDLGLACEYSQKKPQVAVGTPGYVAPEVVAKQPYDSSADWFSFGCTLFALLTGRTPFYSQYLRHKEKKQKNRKVHTDDVELSYALTEQDYPDGISADCRDLLTRLVSASVEDRLGCRTSNGPEELKSHPFFADIDWCRVFARNMKPPLVPRRGDINAENSYEIGRFDERDVKNVVLTKDDQKVYENFNIVISERWQEELTTGLFDSANRDADLAEEKKRAKPKSFNSKDELDSDIILYGYLKKLGGPFSSAWQTRYGKLYTNRLELYPDSEQAKPEMVFMDRVTVAHELQEIKGERSIVVHMVNDPQHQKTQYEHDAKLVLSTKDEISLAEWHNSLITARKLSVDLLQRVNQKAMKIYGLNRDPMLSDGVVEKIAKIFDSTFIGLLMPMKSDESFS